MILPVALLLLAQVVPRPGPAIAVEVTELAATEGHVFARSALPLTLRVLGAQGRRLDLCVQALQLAHALAAPVAPPIEVASGVELGTSAWHELPFVLACPAIERAVTWELRFLARTGTEEAWAPAGSARLVLHPTDILAPLRAAAREQRWFVGDRAGTLKSFLTAERIPFVDLDRPEGRDVWTRSRDLRLAADALVLHVRAAAEPRERRSHVLDEVARALLFEEASPALALRLEPGKVRVTLDLATIARLPHDPRAQLALVEAIELTRSSLSDG